MSLVLSAGSYAPGSIAATAMQHEYSGKTHYSVNPGGVMVPTPSQNSAKNGAGTNWTWDFITSIPTALGWTVKNDTNAVVGGVSSAVHATASGMGSAYDSVVSTASNVASRATSGLEGAAVSAYKQVGQGVSAAEKQIMAVESGAGGIITGAVSTVENSITALSWTPIILVGGLIALMFFFPDHAIKAGKAAAGAVAL